MDETTTVPSTEPKKSRRPKLFKQDYQTCLEAVARYQIACRDGVLKRAGELLGRDFGSYDEMTEFCKSHGISVDCTKEVEDIEKLIEKLCAYC